MSDGIIEQECMQAINLLTSGRAQEAVIAFTEILKKDDKIALAWNNRGLGLLNLGHPFDAVLNIDKAIALEPHGAEFHNNKGAALFDQEDADNALQSFVTATTLKPSFAEALMNRGNVLKYKGDLEGAINSYHESIEARPDYADAHLHLSFATLAAGQYEEGWKEFEWRWKSNQMPERGLPYQPWEGESLDGKTLLIYSEQGFGDALQFIRYAPLAKQRFGGKILVEVRQPMTRLCKTVEGIDEIVTFGEKMPDGIDYQVAMMTLPRLLGTTLDTIPWSGPYFKADPHRAAMWDQNLALLPPGLKIGVCWAGMSRPGNPAAANVDKKRSTTLEMFSPLALTSNVSWVSLQKGSPAEQVQRPPRGMTIGDWTSELDDFYDTAALIERLDLVITVDTAVAHLAAALGKPTWIFSRWDGCWRWLQNRTDSPWYPSVRLFSQPKPGAWKEVAEEAAVALQQYVIEQTKAAA